MCLCDLMGAECKRDDEAPTKASLDELCENVLVILGVLLNPFISDSSF